MNLKSLFRATILLSISGFFLYSCTKRDPEEKPIFPSAEFFSPWFAVPGTDTVQIAGSALDGSTVYLSGNPVDVIRPDSTNDVIAFVVPSDFNGGQVTVEYKNGESVTFVDSLTAITEDDTRGDIEGILFLGDFDGAGIRPASAGIDFNRGAWDLEAPVGAETGIGSNYNGTPPSPAGGNYFYNFVPDGAIGGPATSGWGGRFNSRNEILNDNISSYPMSFADYPYSPVDFEGDADEYYLNFYYRTDSLEVNRNGENPTAIRIYLVDALILQNEQFAFNISNGENMAFAESTPMPFDGEWHGISIKLTRFASNFGFGNNFSDDDLMSFNSVNFVFTDSRVDAEPGEVNGVTEEEEENAGNGPIRAYLDHVSISKGANLYNDQVVN